MEGLIVAGAVGLVIVALCLGLGQLLYTRRRFPEAPAVGAPAPARSAPGPPVHVHTWRLRSGEETAGEHVSVWRCDDCGNVERWVH